MMGNLTNEKERNMKEYLKVKLVSLGLEQHFIRTQEHKAKKLYQNNRKPEFEIQRLEKRLNRYNNSTNKSIDQLCHDRIDECEKQLARWKRKAANAKFQEKRIQNLERSVKLFDSLEFHRKIELRKKARAANIAYGFILGHKYNKIEQKAYTEPNWEEIERLIEKYSEGDKRDIQQKYAEWKTEAVKFI